MEIKQAVFAQLDAAVPGHAILASNTSSLSITEIGEATLRPDKVVGFHYFYPASIMPLIEIVEGEETSAETVGAAVTFAQAIRKQPITCAEVPGFVVNRILNSGTSEIWREQEEKGLSIKKIDDGVGAAGVIPVGPYHLVNLLGLDTVLHVAEHLAESYGERALLRPKGDAEAGLRWQARRQDRWQRLLRPRGKAQHRGRRRPGRRSAHRAAHAEDVRRGMPGTRGGRGDPPRHRLRPDGRRRPGPAARPAAAVHEGRRGGAGRDPRAHGGAQERDGERFAPPTILRRLVAQGRLGQKSGQGFYAYPQPDAEQPAEVVKLETRGDGVAIAWLANGQMNSISPQVVEDLEKVWGKVAAVRHTRSRDRLLQPVPVLRRSGHQGVHDDGRELGASS